MLILGLSPARAALLMALAAAAILTSTLVMQFGFGVEPCQLCIYQRYPYVALVLIGLSGSLGGRPSVALLGGGLIALGSTGLALYHVGIEQGFWALPAGCAAGSEAQTVEELRQMLLEAPPACDQVSFRLLGLSLALWNAVASLMLALLAVLSLSRFVEPVAQPAR